VSADEVRSWTGTILASMLSLTEVTAAFWAKAARGQATDRAASVADRRFSADVLAGRFGLIPVDRAVVELSLPVVRRHRLRGADAVQLATALAARTVDPGVDAFAVFDARLREAAGAEGFALLPSQLR